MSDGSAGAQGDKKPNILVIMGDDREAAIRAVATTSPQRMLIRDVPEPLISKLD